jgi:hypothetical protein
VLLVLPKKSSDRQFLSLKNIANENSNEENFHHATQMKN